MVAPQSAARLTLCPTCDPLMEYATENAFPEGAEDDGVPDGVGWLDGEVLGPDAVGPEEVLVAEGVPLLDGPELGGVVGVGFGSQIKGTQASWNSKRSPGWKASVPPDGTVGSSGAAA